MIDDAAARARTHIRHALLLASAMVVGSLLLTIAHKPLGLIDAETTTRGVMVLIGLMLIVVGNRLPKQNEGPPPRSVGEITTRQAIGRVGGWAMLLGGLSPDGALGFGAAGSGASGKRGGRHRGGRRDAGLYGVALSCLSSVFGTLGRLYKLPARHYRSAVT